MYSLTKTCPKCGVSFERQENRQRYCSKKCRTSQHSQNYRAKNREKLIAQTRAWREANPEKSKQASRAWHERNRDAANAHRRARHERLRDEENAKSAAYHAAHRAESNAARKQWNLNNPDRAKQACAQYRANNREKVQLAKQIYRRKSRETFLGAYLLDSARSRAKKKNLPFDLTDEWLRTRWTGRCEISGIPFVMRTDSPGPKFYSPSVDRIIPALGYIQTNCRIVLWAVNALKHDGTDEDMYRVAKALCASKS